MFVQLGTRPAVDQADIVSLLLDCHQRIHSFVDLSRALASATAASEDDVRQTAARIDTYFTHALPLHVRDEEESLVPRLLGKDAAVDRALEQMAAQHREHAPLLDALRGACRALAADPTLLPAMAARLAALASDLGREFDHHLKLEEETLFPAVSRLLTADDRAAMVRELRGRRGAKP